VVGNARQSSGERHNKRWGDEDTLQGNGTVDNKAGVDNVGRLDSGRHGERRGVEDPTQLQTTHLEEGSRGPNAVVDEAAIYNNKVMVTKMLFNFAVACIPFATFADPCSVVGRMLHCVPLLLFFASVRHSPLPCYLCHSPHG
jgi:hypothetical protein